MGGRTLGRLPGRALVLLALLAAVAISSCRHEARDPALDRGGTIVMAVPDASVMKPDAWDLDFLAFLPLATVDERGDLEGRLARSWEHSADHKEYTFHLRSDAPWHDGVRVTAHDVRFTFELISHPDVLQRAPGCKL